MARQKNDGRGRLGGRQKGTPNKITSLAKSMMQKWLELHNSKLNPDDLQELIWEDFKQLTPQDRVRVTVDLLKMAVPRSIDINGTDGSRLFTIEDKLRELSQDDNQT